MQFGQAKKKSYLHQAAQDGRQQERSEGKQCMRLQTRGRVDSTCCVHVLECKVARVEAVVTSDGFNLGVMDLGEGNIDTLPKD